jgi:uncharacterized tellurite resistance protein B-like protein
MIDIVKKFFNKGAREFGVQEIDQTHDIRIATCALFLEMANIDGEFSELEKDHIIQILKENYNVTDEYVHELIEASDKELKGSIDLWQFTNLINQNYSLEEKIRIIEMVWKLAYADGLLDQHEDYLVHKLANLLRLSHKQLIDAKLKVLHGDNK